MHESRKGVAVNPQPPKEWRALSKVLRRRRGVSGSHPDDGVSIRRAADIIGVTDRTIRRWIAKTHRPDARYHSTIIDASREMIRP